MLFSRVSSEEHFSKRYSTINNDGMSLVVLTVNDDDQHFNYRRSYIRCISAAIFGGVDIPDGSL